MTLAETAARINLLFRKYGLDHDVVQVASHVPPYGTVHIHPIKPDPHENVPDPMQWRTADADLIRNVYEEIVLIDSDDADKMALLFATLDYVFATFFDVHPPSDQLRLF